MENTDRQELQSVPEAPEKQEQNVLKNPMGLVCLHTVAIGYALYMFYSLLRRYLAGGPEAPNLATMIVGGIILLGGSVAVGWLTWRLYRKYKTNKDSQD